ESEVGRGSIFRAILPIRYAPAAVTETGTVEAENAWRDESSGIPVLAIEDTPADVLALRGALEGTPYHLAAARSLREARRMLEARRPAAIVLDIVLKGEDAWSFLAELKHDPDPLPVVIVRTLDDRAKGMALGADAYGI